MSIDWAWVLTLAVAPFVGSFLALVVERWGTGEGVVLGRSRCASCERALTPLDMVPVLSWLMLHGRCRKCGRRIGAFPLVMELSALVVAGWSVVIFPGWLALAGACLGWALLTAAEIDRRHMILPDAMTLPLIPAGLAVIWIWAPDQFTAAMIGVAAGATALWLVRAIYAAIRGREGLGLGDVKLFAAAGAWTTWQGLPSVMLWAGVSGLALALLNGVRRGGLSGGQALPFGPFLAFGFWMVWSFGPIAG